MKQLKPKTRPRSCLELAAGTFPESQRAMLMAKLANMKQGQRTDLPPIGGKLSISIDQAAKDLNVGSRTAERAKKVLTHGSKELIEACDRGEISASKAAMVADLPKDQQLEAAKSKEPSGKAYPSLPGNRGRVTAWQRHVM